MPASIMSHPDWSVCLHAARAHFVSWRYIQSFFQAPKSGMLIAFLYLLVFGGGDELILDRLLLAACPIIHKKRIQVQVHPQTVIHHGRETNPRHCNGRKKGSSKGSGSGSKHPRII